MVHPLSSICYDRRSSSIRIAQKNGQGEPAMFRKWVGADRRTVTDSSGQSPSWESGVLSHIGFLLCFYLGQAA